MNRLSEKRLHLNLAHPVLLPYFFAVEKELSRSVEPEGLEDER